MINYCKCVIFWEINEIPELFLSRLAWEYVFPFISKNPFPPVLRLSLSHSVISKHQIRCRISSHHQFIIIVNQKEIPFAWDIFSLSSGKIAQNSSHSFTFKLAAQAFIVWNHFLAHKYSFILTKNYCRRRNHQMKGFLKVQLLSIFRIWARILNR